MLNASAKNVTTEFDFLHFHLDYYPFSLLPVTNPF